MSSAARAAAVRHHALAGKDPAGTWIYAKNAEFELMHQEKCSYWMGSPFPAKGRLVFLAGNLLKIVLSKSIFLPDALATEVSCRESNQQNDPVDDMKARKNATF
ncbi:hypothetical protein [Tunturiibacter gelidiferens]|uniref:hypothetical protein n=1 Tax=Tunturiibacter gelidiferens TaxID=3069689 RepID=UPI003D9B4680